MSFKATKQQVIFSKLALYLRMGSIVKMTSPDIRVRKRLLLSNSERRLAHDLYANETYEFEDRVVLGKIRAKMITCLIANSITYSEATNNLQLTMLS